MLSRQRAYSASARLATRARPPGKGFAKGCAIWGMWRAVSSRSKRAGREGRPTGFPCWHEKWSRQGGRHRRVVDAGDTGRQGCDNNDPVVMVLASFPDKLGLVESLARPGGNVTALAR